MDSGSFDHALLVAQEAARAAGAELRAWQERFTVKEKGLFDLVTEADVAAQHAVQQVISRAFPEHAFLGEETTAAEREMLLQSKKPLWVVDPLDGTTNYIHHNPCYAVSLGLVIEGKPVVGVVYDPSREELFSAILGGGAALNGRVMRVTAVDQLSQSLLAVGFPADWTGNPEVVSAWEWFGYQTQGMRRTGSSALNLAYVAAGRFDGFFAFQQCPWDVAAGMLLVTEAGGQVTHHDGRAFAVLQANLIAASNGRLHTAILGGLADALIPS
jgi:myo-inositol-1(or 4)-monophosphatase